MEPLGVPLMKIADPRPQIFVGFSPNEMRAHTIALWSIRRGLYDTDGDLRPLVLPALQHDGLYDRPMSKMHKGLWDDISNAPMTTEHAIARFFIPYLCQYRGWAVFMDGDVLVRRPIRDLLALADDRFAVQCVQHPPITDNSPKKDGQIQALYARKNWSSVMLINCGHPANQRLTLNVLNSWAGRDLHGFNWLHEHEIGPLPAEWNYLVGVNHDPPASPAIVHYTLGTPDLPGLYDQPYADEWRTLAQAAGINLHQPQASL